MEVIWDRLIVFLISMVPVLELRGAIPFGAAHELNIFENYFISVIGNILPVPILLLFIKKIFNYLRNFKIFNKIITYLEDRAVKKANSKRFKKYTLFALFIFVAIPLPVSGAFSASLIATVLELRIKDSLLAISAGIMVAGIIVSLLTYGIISSL